MVSARVEELSKEAKARRTAIEKRVAELQAEAQKLVTENVETATDTYGTSSSAARPSSADPQADRRSGHPGPVKKTRAPPHQVDHRQATTAKASQEGAGQEDRQDRHRPRRPPPSDPLRSAQLPPRGPRRIPAGASWCSSRLGDMSGEFQVESTVGLIVFFVLLAVKIYAFGSSLMFSARPTRRPASSTKPAWCVILGLGVALTFIPVGGLTLSIVATIAAFVYLADVRPALAGLPRRS